MKSQSDSSSLIYQIFNKLQSIEIQKANIPQEYLESEHDLVSELIKNQIPDVDESKKLYLSDMKRIIRNIRTSIFNPNICCIWHGYITNLNKTHKGTYINFYFNRKKVALHRLLYSNYEGNIDSTKFIKFSCKNKGSCCNINCLKEYKYKINTKEPSCPTPTQQNTQISIPQHTYTNTNLDISFS